MSKDEELNDLNEQEQEELAELEVGDALSAETEQEGGWDSLDEQGEGVPSTSTEPPEPSPVPAVARPVSIPVPVAPTLQRTGDTLWGKGGPEAEKPKNDMSDLFEVPQEEDNDMYTDDLFELDEEDVGDEESLADLTRVTEEDIMGAPPRSKRPERPQRTQRPYTPPTSMGGTR